MKVLGKRLNVTPPDSQFTGKVRVRVEGLNQYGRPMQGAQSFTLGETTVEEIYALLKEAVKHAESF